MIASIPVVLEPCQPKVESRTGQPHTSGDGPTPKTIRPPIQKDRRPDISEQMKGLNQRYPLILPMSHIIRITKKLQITSLSGADGKCVAAGSLEVGVYVAIEHVYVSARRVGNWSDHRDEGISRVIFVSVMPQPISAIGWIKDSHMT
ncbi:hypothetical protein C6366_00160 [Desulfonatronum sp. SC1]|nr:hypothetical protein C6366_00160 [Desulfonatronum sp. SC1]